MRWRWRSKPKSKDARSGQRPFEKVAVRPGAVSRSFNQVAAKRSLAEICERLPRTPAKWHLTLTWRPTLTAALDFIDGINFSALTK